MNSIVNNLYTNGDDFQLSNGQRYSGYYHILSDGTYKTGNSPESLSNSEVLYPIEFMPVNSAGEVLSLYLDDENDTDEFDGIYSTLTIKTYKNDIDVPTENVSSEEVTPVIITDQPDIFFKKNTSNTYLPGKEVFIDENNTIQIAKGKRITLEFGYDSVDDPSNITFEWRDSFDRLVSTDPILLIDTSQLDVDSETFNCTVTDSYGSDITNDITINIIDPNNNPIIFNNILKNGSAVNGTNDWETVGDNPEEVGSFLTDFEISTDPNGLQRLGIGTFRELGSIYYHKFSKSPAGAPDKNQWYPRPEAIDFYNGFSISDEIKNNYFRGGKMDPILPNQNNHSGTYKSSFQVIDLSDNADLLEGKVYGIKGFKAIFFGWLGSRADQGDKCYAEIEFLDSNDTEIVDVDGNTIIQSLNIRDRIINEARLIPNEPPPTLTTYQLGYDDREFGFVYTGSFGDGNDAIEVEKIKAVNTITQAVADPISGVQTFISQRQIVNGLAKTQIIGRITDSIELPPGTRKIKITKHYIHDAARYDLIRNGSEWDDIGIDYISESMFVGLNVRLYPILIDEDNNEVDTSIDPNTGELVIRGFNMDLFPAPTSLYNYLDDLDLQLERVDLINASYSVGGQLYIGRNDDTATGGTTWGDRKMRNQNGAPNEIAIPWLVEPGYSVAPNTFLLAINTNVVAPSANIVHAAIYRFNDIKEPIYNGTAYVSKTLVDADNEGLLNYGDPTGATVDLGPALDSDNVFL